MSRKQLLPDMVAFCMMACLMLAGFVAIAITQHVKHPPAPKTIKQHGLQSAITPVEYTRYVHSQFADALKVNDMTKAVLNEYLQYRNGQVSYADFHQYVTHAAMNVRQWLTATTGPVPSGYTAYQHRIESVVQAEATGVGLLKNAHGIHMDAMADQLNILIVQFHGIAGAVPKPKWEGHLA